SSSSRRSSSSLSENIVTDEQQSSVNSEGDFDTEMPNLVDSFYSYVSDKYSDYFKFEVTYEYHNDIEADRIIEQDIESGTMVAKGSTVHLVVNKGKEGGDIPSYDGRSVAQYENDLKEAGIVNYSLVRSSNTWGYPDTIVQLQVGGTEVKAGTYFSNKDGKKLLVYYIPEDADIQAPPTQVTDYSQTTATHNSANTTTANTTTVAVTTAVQRTDPPATDPPRTDPPVTNPPVTDPPPVVTDPPPVVTDPPATDPPPVVTDPPESGGVQEW
ncbi:MAG: PASTA domain-containing protein, partial [Ruminococcus sp.]|nr:PASTA domain-containing protein [Ruminococcus sp.]